jgi:hypothetical protein
VRIVGLGEERQERLVNVFLRLLVNAPQELVITFACVLLVARVAEQELGLIIEIVIRANQPAVLSEGSVGQTITKQIQVRGDSQKPRQGRVMIQTVSRTQLVDPPAVGIQQKTEPSGPVS